MSDMLEDFDNSAEAANQNITTNNDIILLSSGSGEKQQANRHPNAIASSTVEICESGQDAVGDNGQRKGHNEDHMAEFVSNNDSPVDIMHGNAAVTANNNNNNNNEEPLLDIDEREGEDNNNNRSKSGTNQPGRGAGARQGERGNMEHPR
jgi:hypothetical protein